MNSKLIAALFVFALIGCRGDEPPRPVAEESCVETGRKSNDILEPTYLPQYPHADRLAVNPLNADECVFRYFDESTSFAVLKYYNRATGEFRTILEAGISHISWHENGWLLFTSRPELAVPANNVYKMRSDGSQLTQLSTGNRDFYPSFNKTGDRITYLSGLVGDLRRYVIDADTKEVIVERLEHYKPLYRTWETDSLLLSNWVPGLYLHNVYTSITDTVIYTNPGESGGEQIRINEELIYYTNDEGIHRFNLITRTGQLIRKTCESMYYLLRGHTTHPETRLILEGREYIPSTTDTIGGELHRDIFLMSLDGYELEQVIIPEG